MDKLVPAQQSRYTRLQECVGAFQGRHIGCNLPLHGDEFESE